MCVENMKLLSQEEEFQFFAIIPTLVILLQEAMHICLSFYAVWTVAGWKSEAELVTLPGTPSSNVGL